MSYDFLSLMLTAALMTLGLAVCSLILGLFLSLIFAVLEANHFVGKPMAVLIALLRGLPEILVVLLVYFGSTELVEMLTGEYIEFGAFGCGVFALSLIFAAYASQTLRGAIQAIPKGQWESGAALGKQKLYVHSQCYATGMASCLTRFKQSMACITKRYSIGFINWRGRFDAPSGSD